MKLVLQAPYGVIENFEEIGSIKDIVNFLECFIDNDEMLLFAFSEDINSIDTVSHRKLIEDRTMFINNEWVFPWEPPQKGVPSINWYAPVGTIEVIDAIKINQLFLCVVLDKKKTFQEYTYMIRKIEEDASFTLCFTEKRSQHFQKYVFPKIKQLFGGINVEGVHYSPNE
ncbi:hypothetical protein [Brevibacillus sp. DP1.3A]|uniref:hypothetical protein n=1 Tax=Brevibacillus sp. DP1.3A TaxID=2738867 RepID=UPI00156B8DBE|nr:hypothetical protein [Brevibacillus sp. DP1.3A]UED73386.1 hypothetical protein HP399_022000 [Brevibacillus sp. DP1.3A]